MKRIFAVSCIMNCGKTHTLNYLAQLLESAGTRIDGPNPMTHPLNTDTQYVFEVKGHRVGVGSSGDDGWTIDEHFNKFEVAEAANMIVSFADSVNINAVSISNEEKASLVAKINEKLEIELKEYLQKEFQDFFPFPSNNRWRNQDRHGE